MRRLLLVVSLLVVAAGACSGGDSSEPTPATVAAGVRGKLLETTDLPKGFEQVAAEALDPDTANSDYCTALDAHKRSFPGVRVGEAQFRRVRGAAAMFVNEQITRYADTSEAARAFADFEKALDQCATVTKNNEDGAIAGTFEPVEFVALGDDLSAMTFNAIQTVDDDSASISGYFIAMRVRSYVVLFSALGSVDTFQNDDVEAIAKRAVARI